MKLDSWEKYFDEEAELENINGITSIWSTIRYFEEILQNLIAKDVEDNVTLEKVTADTRANKAGPSGAKDSDVHAEDQQVMEETEAPPTDPTSIILINLVVLLAPLMVSSPRQWRKLSLYLK